jgi:hypothetical protein
MRIAFLLLVFANLAFFAWWRFVAPPEAVTDAEPLARQIEPERLKVVSAKDLPPAPAKPAPPPAAAATPAPAPAPVATKCLEWGSFTVADAPGAEKRLEPLALGARLTQRHTEETAGWWVLIPPQPGGRAGAQKKAAELKGLGVEDYFIVQDTGANRFALSLGVFRTAEGAQARLAALRQQGVRTAVVRARETVVPKIWLQVANVDPSLEEKLKAVAAAIDGSELRDCP